MKGAGLPFPRPWLAEWQQPRNRPKDRISFVLTQHQSSHSVRCSAVSGDRGEAQRKYRGRYFLVLLSVVLTESSPVLSGHVILSTPRNFSRSVFSSAERRVDRQRLQEGRGG